MSGPRITRKVTVEVGKKVTESVVPSSVVQPSSSSSSSGNPRRSVFERLGPGAVDVSCNVGNNCAWACEKILYFECCLINAQNHVTFERS